MFLLVLWIYSNGIFVCLVRSHQMNHGNSTRVLISSSIFRS